LLAAGELPQVTRNHDRLRADSRNRLGSGREIISGGGGQYALRSGTRESDRNATADAAAAA
jgi:hypothetical protein